MEHFTPITSLAGGALIGVAASVAMLSHGRVAGISGIFAAVLGRRWRDRTFELFFLLGLILAGVGARLVYPSALPAGNPSLPVAAVAGLLVGFGTRRGSGCTSGHGVCGISRLSPRSLAATLMFMVSGIATVAVCHALGGAR